MEKTANFPAKEKPPAARSKWVMCQGTAVSWDSSFRTTTLMPRNDIAVLLDTEKKLNFFKSPNCWQKKIIRFIKNIMEIISNLHSVYSIPKILQWNRSKPISYKSMAFIRHNAKHFYVMFLCAFGLLFTRNFTILWELRWTIIPIIANCFFLNFRYWGSDVM